MSRLMKMKTLIYAEFGERLYRYCIAIIHFTFDHGLDKRNKKK
jgi:hypothetical protein